MTELGSGAQERYDSSENLERNIEEEQRGQDSKGEFKRSTKGHRERRGDGRQAREEQRLNLWSLGRRRQWDGTNI